VGKAGELSKKNSALSEIGDYWIEISFHFFCKSSKFCVKPSSVVLEEKQLL